MRLTAICAALLCLLGAVAAQEVAPLVRLETDLLKTYNKKHRPTRSDKTQLAIKIMMSITHIERVNENEQTAIFHGTLYASWKDEYLNWKPAEYNNTQSMFLEMWKIWQPALSLYNSARGNQWNLYFGSNPASISNEGVVLATGSFSFHVTCQFDFSAWPYDEHRCPIVIADWVYDLSRVNLSDTYGSMDMKPMINLHYDPYDNREKKHVAGWEIVDTSRKHCYWGKKWCQEDIDFTQEPKEHFWSVLQYDVIIRRFAPYIMYTLVFPTLVSCFFTLLSFWTDIWYHPLMLLSFNLLFQALYAWDMIRGLPSGNGNIADMVYFFGFNVTMTLLAFIVHVLVQVLPVTLPKGIELPETVREFATQLRTINFFTRKGLSFDPAELYGTLGDPSETEGEKGGESTASSSSAILAGFDTSASNELLVQMEEGKPDLVTVDDNEVALVEVTTTQPCSSTSEDENKEEEGPATEDAEEEELPPATSEEHAQLARRVIFCLFALAYLWELPRAFF